MPALTLRCGKFIRLKGQPHDLPDFVVLQCRGDRCWIRQQSWGPHVQLQVKVTQVEIPGAAISFKSRISLPNLILVD
ncbi:MAG: hypothetical protein HC886_04755 [Leptolyngbyaceae cyanobacterium SM1_1_3]|nr:hypothetical protein [Leptolyngbyaceae cyanobacterium SM1_1_3]NJN04354.1 hypothetical protein [Leptolyngbyaceae cyanobacterium RM1_1_2]NJO09660.1 hypothetical protein [Leptolyngbyaceae cyanobacterium SL_1_1]